MNNNHQNPTNEMRFPVLIGLPLILGAILWVVLAATARAEAVQTPVEPTCPTAGDVPNDVADAMSVIYLPMLANESVSAAGAEPSVVASGTVNPVDIAIGEVVSGRINQNSGCAVYQFDAAAGDTIFFDVQQAESNTFDWALDDPDDAQLFESCLACGPVVQGIDQSGSYTLTVGNGVGAFQFQLWRVPDPQRFGIFVGETVAEDLPAAGAGHIESPMATDIYTFSAIADQLIFFDVLEFTSTRTISTTQSISTTSPITETFAIKWTVQSPNGDTLFDDCLPCGDRGPFALSKTGIYTLAVGGNVSAAFGTYRFQVLDVSQPERFSIAIGDIVAPDSPAAGAGRIETPGSVDIYTFDAAAGQTVFFDMQTYTATGGIAWAVEDSSGMTLFSECLACGSPGAVALQNGGTYTITVGRRGLDSTGTYQFQLLPVAADERFEIQIGDIVAEDEPSVGAGKIESPGVFDIYTFAATAGETVFFDMLSFTPGLAVAWMLSDASGASIFRDCIACGDPGRIVLEAGGIYTLTVGTPQSTAVGAYAFQLVSISEPDRFEIAIGDTVSQDNPGPGAGHIESPGAEDIYTFTAVAGQVVSFDMQAFAPGLAVRWKLNDADGSQIFRTCMACGDPGPKVLELGGLYTITVGTRNSSAVGTYQFQISLEE